MLPEQGLHSTVYLFILALGPLTIPKEAVASGFCGLPLVSWGKFGRNALK